MRKAFFILFTLFVNSLFSQTSNTIEMADQLRSSGKIYVVVAVLATIFVGIAAYLISIDRKLSKMEKRMNDSK